ncbi:hypothetical protein [Pseudomonas phage D6]|nr:hypothetical protein [Pseudomonas phage D6]
MTYGAVMISEMDGSILQLHTVTVIYDREKRSFQIDRATQEEAAQIAKWFFNGAVSFTEGKGYLINSTRYVKVSKQGRFYVAHISWAEGTENHPFFSYRDFGMDGKVWNSIGNQKLGVFNMCMVEKSVGLIEVGSSSAEVHIEDTLAGIERFQTNPDHDPSIPDELVVEKDEQLKHLARAGLDWLPTPEEVEAKRPVWLGADGSYNAELHKADCDELARMYPQVAVPLDLSEAAQQKLSSTIRAVGGALMTP